MFIFLVISCSGLVVIVVVVVWVDFYIIVRLIVTVPVLIYSITVSPSKDDTGV